MSDNKKCSLQPATPFLLHDKVFYFSRGDGKKIILNYEIFLIKKIRNEYINFMMKKWKEKSRKAESAKNGEFLLYSKLIIIAKRTPFLIFHTATP